MSYVTCVPYELPTLPYLRYAGIGRNHGWRQRRNRGAGSSPRQSVPPSLLMADREQSLLYSKGCGRSTVMKVPLAQSVHERTPHGLSDQLTCLHDGKDQLPYHLCRAVMIRRNRTSSKPRKRHFLLLSIHRPGPCKSGRELRRELRRSLGIFDHLSGELDGDCCDVDLTIGPFDFRRCRLPSRIMASKGRKGL